MQQSAWKESIFPHAQLLVPVHGGKEGMGDHPDGDGIDNGVKNFFGTNPGASSKGLVLSRTQRRRVRLVALRHTHPALARQSQKTAIRVTCSESWLRYATPQWVQQAGARGVEFGGVPRPDGFM